MLTHSTAFCPICGCKTAYILKAQYEELNVRGIVFNYVEHSAYCNECRTEVYVPEVNDENVQAREDAYRKSANLITLTEINDILEKYNIGAGPLAKVLGFGDITINRYLSGQLPSKANSDLLLEVRTSHKKMDHYLELNRDKITDLAYTKCRTALDNLYDFYSGNKIEVVTRYFLSRSYDITPLALQKLLYYAQSFFEALFDQELFTDGCQAWAHGPVYPDIYHKYKNYGYDPISSPEVDFDISVSGLSSREIDFLDAIIKTFGRYSGPILRDITHREQPWLEARGSLPPSERCSTIISRTTIKQYFSTIVKEYGIVTPQDMSIYCNAMLSCL